MKIKKIDLLEALEIVKPALASKESAAITDQTTSFAFLRNRIITYNDEISISHPIPDLGVQGAVEAKSLYQIIAKVKKDEIEILEGDNEILLTSGRMKAGLTIKKEITLPLEEVEAKKDWYKLPATFLNLLGFTANVCGRDMSRPVLTCVHINKAGFLEGSDGFRLVNCQLGEEMSIRTILIPAKSALEVVKFDPVEISDGSGWVHFRSEQGSVLSCRILTDTYPDASKLFIKEGAEIVFPKTISALLDKAGVFAARDIVLEESVEITLADNRMQVKSKSETGWYEESVNVKHKGDKIHFTITPYLLKGILKETNTCIYSKSALQFESENWKYLSMLRKD